MNLVAVSGLIFSYLSMHVPPTRFWWFALFGLGYGLLLALNIFFILFWIWRRSRKFMVSLFVCLAGLGSILNIYEPPLFRNIEPDRSRYVHPLKVMSFNVRLFDLYNWFHSKNTRDNIFKFLSEESPDIACFQEFYTSENPKYGLRNKDTLVRVLKAPYSHINYSVTMRGTDHWGIATYSRYPIIRKRTLDFPGKTNNVCLVSDIVVGDDTIRVFNIHLESIRFKKEDYRFIENLGNDEVDQDELAGGLNILRRLKYAFVKRSDQVAQVSREVSKSPYPVVLMGDFNDTPNSYAVRILSEEMKDAFRESGTGFGKTYSGPFPSFRIDYIFHEKEI
ncbi:MAG: endonuclease/exonuclease/phosphatase family protein, partial [Bacteroidota bacterium]